MKNFLYRKIDGNAKNDFNYLWEYVTCYFAPEWCENVSSSKSRSETGMRCFTDDFLKNSWKTCDIHSLQTSNDINSISVEINPIHSKDQFDA